VRAAAAPDQKKYSIQFNPVKPRPALSTELTRSDDVGVGQLLNLYSPKDSLQIDSLGRIDARFHN
jgi:hypothetical protein